MKNNLGLMIFQWRQKCNYKQEVAASMLGVSQSVLSKWEGGTAQINVRHLPVIAKICKINIEPYISKDLQITITSITNEDVQHEVSALELYKQLVASKDTHIEDLKAKIKLLEDKLSKFEGG